MEGQSLKIKDLKPFSKNVNLVFKVIEKGERKQLTSRGTGDTHVYCEATVADETGAITFSLWDAEIDFCQEGSVYELCNGYVNVYLMQETCIIIHLFISVW